MATGCDVVSDSYEFAKALTDSLLFFWWCVFQIALFSRFFEDPKKNKGKSIMQDELIFFSVVEVEPA